jgi:hypothetical protein
MAGEAKAPEDPESALQQVVRQVFNERVGLLSAKPPLITGIGALFGRTVDDILKKMCNAPDVEERRFLANVAIAGTRMFEAFADPVAGDSAGLAYWKTRSDKDLAKRLTGALGAIMKVCPFNPDRNPTSNF